MPKSMPAKLARALQGVVDPAAVVLFGPAQLLPVDRKQTYQQAATNAVRIAATSWTGVATYKVAAGGFYVITSDLLAIVRRHDNLTQPWDLLLAGPLSGVEAATGGNGFRPTMTLIDLGRDEPIIRLGFPLFSKKRDRALGLINAGA